MQKADEFNIKIKIYKIIMDLIILFIKFQFFN